MNTDGNTNLPAPTTALKPWTKNGLSPNPRGRGHSPNAFSKAFLKSVSAKWMDTATMS